MPAPASRSRTAPAQILLFLLLVAGGLALYFWAVPRTPVVITPAAGATP